MPSQFNFYYTHQKEGNVIRKRIRVLFSCFYIKALQLPTVFIYLWTAGIFFSVVIKITSKLKEGYLHVKCWKDLSNIHHGFFTVHTKAWRRHIVVRKEKTVKQWDGAWSRNIIKCMKRHNQDLVDWRQYKSSRFSFSKIEELRKFSIILWKK